MDVPPFFKGVKPLKNGAKQKSHFLLCELKKAMEGLFQQPVRCVYTGVWSLANRAGFGCTLTCGRNCWRQPTVLVKPGREGRGGNNRKCAAGRLKSMQMSLHLIEHQLLEQGVGVLLPGLIEQHHEDHPLELIERDLLDLQRHGAVYHQLARAGVEQAAMLHEQDEAAAVGIELLRLLRRVVAERVRAAAKRQAVVLLAQGREALEPGKGLADLALGEAYMDGTLVVEDGDKIVRVTVSTRTEKNRTEGWGGQGGWGGYGGRTRRTGEEANLSIELLAPLPDGRCESLRTISLSGSGRNIEWEVFTPYGGAGRRTDGGRRRIKGYRAALEAALEELFSGR